MSFILFFLACNAPDSISNGDDHPVYSPVHPVIIIGGGASGISTAIRLLELDIEPLILEKESVLGGAGIHAGRFFAVNTPWQIDQGIIDSPTTAITEWEDFTGSVSDDQVEHFITESASILEWITSYDISFSSVQPDIGAGSVPRLHALSPDTPHPLALWSELLSPYAKHNQTVTALEKQENVFIVTTENNVYYADNVVIATGGFARNETIVSESLPEIDNYNWHMEAWFGMVGDAIPWLTELSVPLQNMEHIGLYAHGVTDVNLGTPEIMVIPALERSLILNQDGERPFNEQYTQSLRSGQFMLEHQRLFAIFDQPLWEGTFFQGMGYNYTTPPILTSTQYAEVTGLTAYPELRDLAQDLNLDVNTTLNTVSTYNTGIQQGSDALGKDISRLPPLQTPPFYAVELQVSTGKSFGGATVNQMGETIIEGLYTVGESAGFLGTPQVGWGFSGSITACYYLGKQTAEQIAETYSE